MKFIDEKLLIESFSYVLAQTFIELSGIAAQWLACWPTSLKTERLRVQIMPGCFSLSIFLGLRPTP